jgi:hypothetical protein
MNNYAAAADYRGGISIICGLHHAVIDNRVSIILVPYLDTELVCASTAVDLAIGVMATGTTLSLDYQALRE